VQLKIEQEDSSPGAKLTDSADISTNKRSIKTTVLIEDGGVIVLGGLMSDTVTESEDRVPGLGAIPSSAICSSRAAARARRRTCWCSSARRSARRRSHREHQRGEVHEVRQEKRLHKGHITLLPGEKQPSIPPYPAGIGPPTQPPAGECSRAPRPTQPHAGFGRPRSNPPPASAAAESRRPSPPQPTTRARPPRRNRRRHPNP
jgi:general secretion pathway protein D